MVSIKSVLRLTAPLALALFVAPSAYAISEFSAVFCGDPTDAAGDVSEFAGEFGGTEKECKTFCKGLEKTCSDLAKSYEQCIKSGDKNTGKLDKDFCKTLENKDDQKSCKDEVKSFEKECKDELKSLKNQAKDNCDDDFGKNSSCVDDCTLVL